MATGVEREEVRRPLLRGFHNLGALVDMLEVHDQDETLEAKTSTVLIENALYEAWETLAGRKPTEVDLAKAKELREKVIGLRKEVSAKADSEDPRVNLTARQALEGKVDAMEATLGIDDPNLDLFKGIAHFVRFAMFEHAWKVASADKYPSYPFLGIRSGVVIVASEMALNDLEAGSAYAVRVISARETPVMSEAPRPISPDTY